MGMYNIGWDIGTRICYPVVFSLTHMCIWITAGMKHTHGRKPFSAAPILMFYVMVVLW